MVESARCFIKFVFCSYSRALLNPTDYGEVEKGPTCENNQSNQPGIKMLMQKHRDCLISSIFVFLCLTTFSIAQVIQSYEINNTVPDRGGLLGNSITDLIWEDGTLYVGTGFGLSVTSEEGETWTNYAPEDYGGRGGVSAMDVNPDGSIWIAVGADTVVQDDQRLQLGQGLRYLHPDSNDWVRIAQPIDARDDTLGGKQPTTTPVQNITFDMAVVDTNEIWIASWGGGVRRTTDRGQTWEVITTDGKPFDAGGNFNHLGFSVLSVNNTIWVGTVGGISKSTNGGQTWQRFTHTNQNQPISGNWVIGMWHNPYDNSIWATTLRGNDETGTEFNAISKTDNGGLTWEIHLQEELSDGTFPRYVAFYDSAVYVASEKGVYKSIDDGATWLKLPPIVDSVSGEKLLTSTFFSVATSATSPQNPDHRLWVGSADGLASTENSGFEWTVYRSFISTRERPDPAVYAYPNPYSPLHTDRPCRFQFDITDATDVTIDIYNFAMERVISINQSHGAPTEGTYDRSITWDGKDNNGRMVDNGVYFFRAKVGEDVHWGKIVIVN